MKKMIDEIRLTFLESVTAAATPGPWVMIEDRDEEGEFTYLDVGGDYTDDILNDYDAAFASAARKAVPELVAEVRRMRATFIGKDLENSELQERVARAEAGRHRQWYNEVHDEITLLNTENAKLRTELANAQALTDVHKTSAFAALEKATSAEAQVIRLQRAVILNTMHVCYHKFSEIDADEHGHVICRVCERLKAERVASLAATCCNCDSPAQEGSVFCAGCEPNVEAQ
jgi:hypothetical protein